MSAELRRSIERVAVPDDLKDMITAAIAELGDDGAYAIRSSATAEDSPSASFAGQHDTYLNIVDASMVIEHVKRCWASLFTERAVMYRMRNGLGHHKVEMAVVVQQMVSAEAAGVLFTVDPVTSNRKVSSVEASFGVGEILVSGHVNPDRYQVRGDTIVSKSIGGKKVAVTASASDGTHQVEIEAERQHPPALTDAQVVRLVELGRRIEAHFGSPQDIEWCLADGGFQIVQSRPITTLFPIPAASDDENHVYVSVGHQQMMTDAMKPLGLSVWQLTTPKPMAEAGGRLFVDFDQLADVEGGSEVRDVIRAFLDRYGMRCVGEIDITRPRWSERPATLLPMILGNVKAFEPGAGAKRFEEGRQEASAKEHELIRRLRDLPDGDQKAAEAKRMIDRVRTFSGYREYPKYAMVSRYFLYRQALLKEAERLVQAGLLHDIDDIFFLRFDELHTAVSTEQVDEKLIVERRDAFKLYESLTPPRVITSDGDVVAGSYRRDNVPADALVGLAVSAGIIEGRARVLLDIENANLEPGDILVTIFTDPSWTPLFLSITGLVTEVGGLMTHGSVIAREYGVPAVVGVQNATRLIQDGQRIRVNGTDGYIKILPSPGQPETSRAGS